MKKVNATGIQILRDESFGLSLIIYRWLSAILIERPYLSNHWLCLWRVGSLKFSGREFVYIKYGYVRWQALWHKSQLKRHFSIFLNLVNPVIYIYSAIYSYSLRNAANFKGSHNILSGINLKTIARFMWNIRYLHQVISKWPLMATEEMAP